MKLQRLAVTLWVGLLVPGCGQDDAGNTDAGGGSGGSGGDAAVSGPEVSIGQFTLELNAPRAATALSGARPGSTSIVGTVGDKAKAEQLVWEVANESGGCTLLVPRAPFCDPDCGREICVEDNVCEADRALQDVGTVTLSGVTTNDGAHELPLISVRNTYQNGLIEMPYPAFSPGDAITLSATGGPSAPFDTPFTIETLGTEVLVTPAVDYPIEMGAPLALTWTAPTDPNTSRILIGLDISHHGGSKGKIECDVEDNGALTIPAELVSELMALGVAGFPSIVITRHAGNHAQLPSGRVHFVVSEYAERWILVPGLVSCTSADQCPTDQTCRDDKTCG